MLVNMLIGYAVINAAILGLASAVMHGSEDSKLSKFFIGLFILAFGALAVVVYFLLPSKQFNRFNGAIMRRRASKSQRVIYKLKKL